MNAISTNEWTARFAARLRRLQMNAGGVSANLVANERYVEASDLDPEEAAEIYAAESMPEDPGAPGD